MYIHSCIQRNIIVIYLSFPANFPLSVFDRQIIDATLLCPLISTDPLLSYINHCTAHYWAVLFWIHFCQDQIKVIAVLTLAIISIGACLLWTGFFENFIGKLPTYLGYLFPR
jgi:hypothetical protein